MSEYINFNETSIANLKKAEDMNVNDYFLIQPQDFNNQAMILSYKNLIFGLDNVSFANTITQHTTDIAQLSTATNNISSVDITGLIERCNDLQKQINNINAQQLNLPVGFVICLGSKDPSSASDEKPRYTNTEVNEMFGGTWERFAQGRMLLGSDYADDKSNDSNMYTNLETVSGEAEHTLTIDEIPEHNHNLLMTPTGDSPSLTAAPYRGALNKTEFSNLTAIQPAGGNQPHNNMPPYIVVDMWKKVSDESLAE